MSAAAAIISGPRCSSSPCKALCRQLTAWASVGVWAQLAEDKTITSEMTAIEMVSLFATSGVSMKYPKNMICAFSRIFDFEFEPYNAFWRLICHASAIYFIATGRARSIMDMNSWPSRMNQILLVAKGQIKNKHIVNIGIFLFLIAMFGWRGENHAAEAAEPSGGCVTLWALEVLQYGHPQRNSIDVGIGPNVCSFAHFLPSARMRPFHELWHWASPTRNSQQRSIRLCKRRVATLNAHICPEA